MIRVARLLRKLCRSFIPARSAAESPVHPKPKPEPETEIIMPKYTLKVCIAKIEQGEAGAPDVPQHSVSIQSNNLSLEDTQAMQEELVPALLGWIKKDEV
jgi:hypothetical protein